jgi:hypothetical protein
VAGVCAAFPGRCPTGLDRPVLNLAGSVVSGAV